MGRKKVCKVDLVMSKYKKCKRVKIRCTRDDKSTGITLNKVYDIENNRQNDYMILNDRKELIPVNKGWFNLVNDGNPLQGEKMVDILGGTIPDNAERISG